MIGFEIVKILLEVVIAIEGYLILAKKEEKEVEPAHISRREIHGTFKDPLDSPYRKNSKGLYVPIKPSGREYNPRPHLGDEEDEV